MCRGSASAYRNAAIHAAHNAAVFQHNAFCHMLCALRGVPFRKRGGNTVGVCSAYSRRGL